MNVSSTMMAARIFTRITAVAIDFEGRILLWNEGAERTYGLTAAAMTGRPLSQAFRCKFASGQSEVAVLRVAREAGRWSGGCEQTLADGRKLLVEVEIALLRDDGQREIGFSLVMRDAGDRMKQETEKRRTAERAEEEARQKWEQLRWNGNVLESFLENLPVCAYVKDEKGRYLFNNRATREAVRGAAVCAGKTDEEIFGLETGQAYRAADVAVLTSDHPIQTVETLEVEGRESSFLTVKFPMNDAKGNRYVGGVSVDITDSIRDREMLRRQAALLDLSTNAILMIDLEGKITYWNQGAERLYGWERAEVLGRDSFEVLKGEFAVPYEAIWEQYVREGTWEGEITVRTKQGEPIRVLSQWTLLRDADGKPIAGMGISTDITATKLAFEELRRAEAEAAARAAELSAVLDAMPAATFIAHDRECRTMTSSRFAYELLRLPHGANSSKSAPVEKRPTFKILRDGNEIPASGLPMQLAAATGEPVNNSTLTIAFEDGTSRDIFGHAVPLLEEDGTVRGAVGAFIDVTDRNRAVEAMQRREAVLRCVMEAAPDFIFMKDCDGRYVTINCAAADSLGRPEAEIVGKDDYALFPGDIAERFRREDAETIASGVPCEFVNEVELNGRRLQLQTMKSVCRSPSGEVIGVVGITRDITESQSLDAALRQRERELTEAHRIAKLGTWSLRLESGEVKWSEEVFRAFAQDPVLGQPNYGEILVMLTPDSRARLEVAVSRAQADGTPYELDIEIRWPDGSTRWIIARGEVDEWDDGKVTGLRGTIQDITERKRTEFERLEALQRLEALMNALPVGVSFSDDVTCQRITGNPAMLAQLEAGPGTNLSATAAEPNAPGRRISFYRNDERLTPDQLPLRRAVAENQAIPCMEMEVELPSGRRWIAEGYGAPVRDAMGNVVGGVAVTVDVTERKQVEAALKEREERFRALAESLPQLVWIRNPEGHYVYANQRLHDYLGLTAGSLSSLGYEFIHPDDLQETMVNWTRSVQTGEDYANGYRLRRVDGAYRHFLARAVPVRDENGRILQWLGTSTDVHDQKLAEDALRKTEKLNTAAKFAASMAHEINNPLNSVMNSVYLALQDNDLNFGTRELLANADRELARTTQVVKQTLRFHRQTTARSFVDLGKLMDSVLALYQTRFRPNSMHLETEYLTDQKLMCFSEEMRQVFGNLVSNALDSMKRGGNLRIRVAQGRGWKRGGVPGIRISVADNGAGIPVELRKRVFEPFVSSKDSTGTGLGLWVTHGIVQKHNGTIAFRSWTGSERSGTVFSVFLPLVSDEGTIEV